MNLDVKPAVKPPAPLELESFFQVSADRPNRRVLVQSPGLKVVHLTLAPGQGLPPHRHPGCTVLVQGLSGTTTVQLEEETTLPAQHLLFFSGDTLVSLKNGGETPCALLITLVGRDERSKDENPSPARDPRVP